MSAAHDAFFTVIDRLTFPLVTRLHFWGLRGNSDRWYRRLALRKSIHWTRVPKEPWE